MSEFRELCFIKTMRNVIYYLKVRVLKAPKHEYIFSKCSWNLVKNILIKLFSKYSWNLMKNILTIFRGVAWNYSNNYLRICLFMYVCFWKQKKFLNFNRFSLISLKNFEFQIKLVWFETWNFKFWLTSENGFFYIS